MELWKQTSELLHSGGSVPVCMQVVKERGLLSNARPKRLVMLDENVARSSLYSLFPFLRELGRYLTGI